MMALSLNKMAQVCLSVRLAFCVSVCLLVWFLGFTEIYQELPKITEDLGISLPTPVNSEFGQTLNMFFNS